MEYTNFGHSRCQSKPISVSLGLRGQSDEAVAQRLVEHAIDKGINVLTISQYLRANGQSWQCRAAEEIVGRAIQGKRDDLFLTTK